MRFPTAAAIFAASVTALSGASAPVRGQEFLPLGVEGPLLQLELTKPFVSADGPFAGASFATTAWDATVEYPVGSTAALFARMGFLYAAMEGVDGSLAITSPRLGALISSATRNRWAELHVDLPLATDYGETYASGIGVFSDFEEQERYLADTWAVGVNGSARFEPGPSSFLGARVGSTVHVPSEGSTDVFARASVWGDAPTDRTRFRIEFSSLYLVTREDLDFSERSTFFASLDISWPFARFNPTLFARAPIDGTLDARVPIVAGARLSFGG
jgi:hypothetical protein